LSLLQDGLSVPERIQLLRSFDIITKISKWIIQIVVTASTTEALDNDNENQNNKATMTNFQTAFQSAQLLVDELVDDGNPIVRRASSNPVPKKKQQQQQQKQQVPSKHHQEESMICMSPQRLCRYSNHYNSPSNSSNDTNNNNELSSSTYREIFGAHVDSTFITAVPVSETFGLEIYDELNQYWYRPEAIAQRHYNMSYNSSPNSSSGSPTTSSYPWYTRYIVYLPGELLQLVTRNEIVASVHRVVACHNASQPRYSVPVLVRGRMGIPFDCSRYMGRPYSQYIDPPLLQQCDNHNMLMDDIMNILG
jgi:hypothetical protein